MPEQGDIVLIPVPFTDLSSSKKRPVIVISNDDYHRSSDDMVVVAMTSNPEAVTYGFVITTSDLENGVLKRPSTVRVDKIYTLSQNLITRIFGRVNSEKMDIIRRLLNELIQGD